MTTTDRQTRRLYPWDSWGSQVEVRPEEWTWAMDLKLGEPRVLDQQFEHKRDTDGLSVKRKSVSPPHNPLNWPKLAFPQVKAIYDTAKAEDTSLKRAFMKITDRKKLSDEQIEVLADAPDLYIEGPRPEKVAEGEAERRAKAKAFLDEVDGTPVEAPAAPKVLRQVRDPVKV